MQDQVSSPASKSGSLRIYACGGFGINISQHFDSAVTKPEPGIAQIHIAYADTSRSNIKPSVPEERIFLIEGVDGSGKIRRENHQVIGRSVRNVLNTHRPQDMNLVVFSAAGGSGSVFGPLIVGELLERGLPVIALVLGSAESLITAQNTVNTLKSLENIAEKRDLPVVMIYARNANDVSREDTDRYFHRAIGALAVLASRQNAELDTKDIQNWVQFNKTTSVGPRLAAMEIAINEAPPADPEAISIASLYANTKIQPLNLVPEYHCAGYMTTNNESVEQMHFAISIDDVPDIARDMQAVVQELDERRRARIQVDRLVRETDEVTDDGMVL